MRSAGILVLFAACVTGRAGGGSSDGATFRVFYPDQPATGFRAKVGKRFLVKPVATCAYPNGRDARWSMTGARVASGELPDGFTLEEGAIGGIAKAAGTWSFRVEFAGVTCAGTPHPAVVVPVIVNAE